MKCLEHVEINLALCGDVSVSIYLVFSVTEGFLASGYIFLLTILLSFHIKPTWSIWFNDSI